MTQPTLSAPTRRKRRPKRSPFAILLGLIGELLITAGIFVGLFVVWQLYWTDFEMRREQVGIRAEFEAAAPQADPEDILEDSEKLYDDVPLLPEVGPGEIQAALRIPALNEFVGGDYWYQIAQHISPMETALDIGHIVRYEGTADPGQIGNFAMAGHRQTHGSPLLHVAELEVGDAIIVESADTWYVFRLSDYKITVPTDVDVVAANPYDPGAQPTERLLTLTTCHPIFSTRERYILHATFEYWAPKTAGTPAEMLED